MLHAGLDPERGEEPAPVVAVRAALDETARIGASGLADRAHEELGASRSREASDPLASAKRLRKPVAWPRSDIATLIADTASGTVAYE